MARNKSEKTSTVPEGPDFVASLLEGGSDLVARLEAGLLDEPLPLGPAFREHHVYKISDGEDYFYSATSMNQAFRLHMEQMDIEGVEEFSLTYLTISRFDADGAREVSMACEEHGSSCANLYDCAQHGAGLIYCSGH